MTPIERYMGDWVTLIPENVLNTYRTMIMQAALNGISIEPIPERIFYAFRKCSLDNCCAVVLGQDPYPQKGVSTGIAFGNELTGGQRMSPSLEVIYLSVTRNSEDLPIFDTSLESWEKQGILMLNSALTVKTNIPGSHSQAWKPFTSTVVELLSERKPDIFWLLLGKQAWEFKDCIKNQHNNVLMERHPAFYSRTNTPMPTKTWDTMLEYIERTFGRKIALYE